MAEPEPLDALAGEYVLGTLPADARRAFAARILVDREAAQAVRDWQDRLALLDATAPELTPGAHVWEHIAARIAPSPAGNFGAANEGARAWKLIAALTTAAAAVLAFIALRPDAPGASAPKAPAPLLVAALSEAGSQPALLVTADPASGRLVARAVSLSAPQGKSLELWYIGGAAAPRSLGLLDGRAALTATLAAATTSDGATIAVSLEPLGGSTTGAPTGPVLYSGQLNKVTPGI